MPLLTPKAVSRLESELGGMEASARDAASSATQWKAAAEEAQRAANKAAAEAAVARESGAGAAADRVARLQGELEGARRREAEAATKATALAGKVAELEAAAALVTGVHGQQVRRCAPAATAVGLSSPHNPQVPWRQIL